jgi:hypothetical protein
MIARANYPFGKQLVHFFLFYADNLIKNFQAHLKLVSKIKTPESLTAKVFFAT